MEFVSIDKPFLSQETLNTEKKHFKNVEEYATRPNGPNWAGAYQSFRMHLKCSKSTSQDPVFNELYSESSWVLTHPYMEDTRSLESYPYVFLSTVRAFDKLTW